MFKSKMNILSIKNILLLSSLTIILFKPINSSPNKSKQKAKKKAKQKNKQKTSLNFNVQGLQQNKITIREKVSKQTKSITTSGSYTFPKPINLNSKYALVITNQQSNQKCTIQNATGRASKADVIITCKTTINHLVIIGIDGMGGAYLDDASNNVRKPNLPNIKSLQSSSAWTFLAQDALPSSSSTNWCSILGGNPPDIHGVLSNSWERGDSVIPPTLFSITRNAYPSSKIGLFYDWDGLGRLIEDDVADVKTSPGDEYDTTNAAIEYIKTKPLLTFIHLDLCDHAGHESGWGSEEYVSSLEEADALIGSIITALKNENMWENTALLISSDHGGEGYSHGDDEYLERSIPFIVRTPQSVGRKIVREVRVWDVAATAAHFLGLKHPSFWLSTPIYEAIPFSPEWTASEIYYKVIENFEVVYDTNDTSMNNDLSIIRPILPMGYISLGDVALPNVGDIRECHYESNCSCLNDNSDYRGTIAKTSSNKTCQKWTDQSPHQHSRTPDNYPNAGLGNHNYCRNPDGTEGAWCYTTDENIRWEICTIPSCPKTKVTTIAIQANHPGVVYPAGFELIWTSVGSSSDEKKLSLWNPIPPPGEYTCPGQVASTSYDQPPKVSTIACIHDTYLTNNFVSNTNYIWNDSGSGADMDGSIWNCKGLSSSILDPNLFLSRRDSNDAGNNDCHVLLKSKFTLRK